MLYAQKELLYASLLSILTFSSQWLTDPCPILHITTPILSSWPAATPPEPCSPCLLRAPSPAWRSCRLYAVHAVLSCRILEFHIVSDHIFLAATMLISLHTEVVCLMSDLLRVEDTLADQPGNSNSGPASLSVSEVLLALLLVLALFLYLFTAADMYFTAKYYHFPLVGWACSLYWGV